MNNQQILEAFNQEFPVPTDAITSAIDRQAEITPILLDLIKDIAAQKDNFLNYENKDNAIALFLLAQFREQQAFPYIMQLANLPEDAGEDFWGDLTTEHLTSFIVSTYNGDLQSIKNLIENRDAYVWSRISALNSLLGLFATQQLSRDEIIAYYRTIFASDWLKSDDDFFIDFFAYDVYKFYPQELYTQLVYLFDEGLADDCIFGGKEAIDDVLKLGMDACLKKYVYDDKYHLPITNLFDNVGRLYREVIDEDDEYDVDDYDNDEEEEYDDANDKCRRVGCCVKQEPIRVIKIGRNESCPCDSGKKYKKCCSA